MQFPSLQGIVEIKKLIARKYNQDLQDIRQWWNDHDSGARKWTQLSISGDISITGSGNGMVVTTPDGTKTYRIAIDNLGQITTQELT